MKKLFLLICITVPLTAHPPDAPLAAYGPAKMAAGFYFDHSGQDIFDDSQRTPSLLNTTGGQVTFAPFRVLHFGAYIGAAEFDHKAPRDDPDGPAFNADFNLTYGGCAKAFTPGFLSDRMRVFASGSAGHFKVEDDFKNVRKAWEFHAGLGVQYTPLKLLTIGVGGELYVLDGEQEHTSVSGVGFGNRDYYRGLLSFELCPKTNSEFIEGQPFISLSFRFTGDMGWDDDLGLKNASLNVSVGWITDFLYGKYKEEQEEE